MRVLVSCNEHRRALRENPKSFEELVSLTKIAFRPVLDNLDATIHLCFQWVDEDGDKITVSSDAELTEAFNTFEKCGELCLQLVRDVDTTLLPPEEEVEGWVLVDAEAAKVEETSLASGADQRDDPKVIDSDGPSQSRPVEVLPNVTTALPAAAFSMGSLGSCVSLPGGSAASSPFTTSLASSVSSAKSSAIAATGVVQPQPSNPVPPPPTTTPPATVSRNSPSWETRNADPELWTLMLQLSEMGFGENFDVLREALERNNMELSATAMDLATSRRV